MRFEDLPLFADDALLGLAILGQTRAKEWKLFVAHYEGRGLPPLDAFAGGRYVPAVRQFLDRINGVDGAAPFPARDGHEVREAEWHKRRS
ncbi:MAG: hypothetical protein C5B60_10230 [Chloroflexi bacterium]|nr:MAG: hypothetical protein C5B60_10230 [Chloroflexota bacterium]